MKLPLYVIMLLLSAMSVFAASLEFDGAIENTHMNCGFRSGVAPNCLQGNFSVNASEMEGGDFTTSGSWCNSSNGYYFINGTDSINYDNITAFQNITQFTIVVGFTPFNVSRFGGIISLFNNDLSQTGWTLRTLNTSFLGFRVVNATTDTSYTFDENNHSGIQNNQNYTLVMTFDGLDFRVWLNNIQIERQTFTSELVAPSTAKIRLGYYNSTSVNRFVGQIHFFQLYNYSLTPYQAANRTKVICGQELYPINTQRTGVFPVTNGTASDWENASSFTRLSDPYTFRQFSGHANNLDFHRGVDFSEGTLGQPIYAIMNGTVVVAEADETNNGTGRQRFGNWVLLEHSPDPDTGQPRHTAYMHMNQTPSVTENQTVVQGQILGYVGSSGNGINTVHLHLELLRDLNGDAYANRSAIHPFRLFDYTNFDNTNITSTTNATHHIIALSHGYNDMDFMRIKFVGTLANRTVDYEDKTGLNLTNPDQSCVYDVCFIPDQWSAPYPVYKINFSVPRTVLGDLVGVVIGDAKGTIETYEPAAPPNVTISMSHEDSPDPVNVSMFLTLRVQLNVTNGTLYNVTLSENYSSSFRFLNATTSPVSGTNNTFRLGNLSAGNYGVNITMLVLNVSNQTVATLANITYANGTGTVFTSSATATTVVVNTTMDPATNVTLTFALEDEPDPVNVSTMLTYRVLVNVLGGTLYNLTVFANYSSSVRFQNATTTPLAGTNTTFLLGNLSTGNYALNISALVLNVSNSTIDNNFNISYANVSGIRFSARANGTTVVVNTTQDVVVTPDQTTDDEGDGDDEEFVIPDSTCIPRWECAWWGPCKSGTQSRTCIALTRCPGDLNIPATIQSCNQTKPTKSVIEVPAPRVDSCVNCEQGCGCYLAESRRVSQALIMGAFILTALSVFYVLMMQMRKQ